MMAADLPLYIKLLAKDLASKTIKNVSREVGILGKISGHAQRGVQNLATNLTRLGVVAGAGIGVMVKSGLDSLVTLESAISSVDAAIDQMNLTTSGSQVATWANEIESAVGAAFDDKDILAATENIIRYGKVTDSNLRPAMVIMTDLAAKTGDVKTASELLGKALADPAKAAGKLARYGIILTKQQQAQIKAMTEAGDVAGAQALLLAELERTTKGAAAASQGPYARAMATLADVTEDAQRALAEGFLPVLSRAAELLKGALSDPSTMKGIRDFGKTLASGLDSLISIAQNLPWQQIGDSLKLAGQGAKAVLGAFTSLPPWVQTAVLTGWGLNKLTGGALRGIVGELAKGLVRGVLGITAGTVIVKGPVAGLPGIGGKGGLPGGAVPGGVAGAAGIAGTGIGAGTALVAAAAGIAAGVVIAKGADLLESLQTPEARKNTASQGRARVANVTANGSGVVPKKLDSVSTAIKNGFAVELTTLKNGFVTSRQSSDGVKGAIGSLNASTGFKLANVASAARATAGAVATNTGVLRGKNFSPKITVPVSVTTNVSVRSQQRAVAVYHRYNARAL